MASLVRKNSKHDRPKCFGSIDVVFVEARAENGCDDCPHENACANVKDSTEEGDRKMKEFYKMLDSEKNTVEVKHCSECGAKL